MNIADEFMTDIDLTLGRFKYAKAFAPGLFDNWATFKFHLNKRFVGFPRRPKESDIYPPLQIIRHCCDGAV